MRIGIEITPIGATPTGVGYYTRHLLAELVRQRQDHSYVGFASGVRALDLSGIPIPFRRMPVPTRLLYTLWNATGMPRVDRFLGGVDVYHAVNYVLPPLARAARVLTVHDLAFLRHPKWCSPKIVGPFSRTIVRHVQRAHAVIACSQATRGDILELLDAKPERVHVVYEAADALFRPVDRTLAQKRVQDALGVAPPYLLFVGAIEPRKNIATLLQAFAAARLPHRLVLAGGWGWNSASIPEEAVRLGIMDRLVFTGYVRDRSLFPALYSAADLFVFPSWYEGFGLPVIEAMACGCPVVCSTAASLPEVGGDAPEYVAPEDVDGLAAALVRISEDAALREDMRAKGLRQAHQFSWERCAAETLACYGNARSCE